MARGNFKKQPFAWKESVQVGQVQKANKVTNCYRVEVGITNTGAAICNLREFYPHAETGQYLPAKQGVAIPQGNIADVIQLLSEGQVALNDLVSKMQELPAPRTPATTD